MGLTVDDILSQPHCSPYDQREVVEGYFNGKTECEIEDFLAMDLPVYDKVFVLIKGGLIPQNIIDKLYIAFKSRIPPDGWLLQESVDCASAALNAQRYAKRAGGSTVEAEAEWQLQTILEAINA